MHELTDTFSLTKFKDKKLKYEIYKYSVIEQMISKFNSTIRVRIHYIC